jgi:hypothetical protein
VLSIIATSAHSAASDKFITFKPLDSAFALLADPSLRATTTSLAPLSFKFSACACP